MTTTQPQKRPVLRTTRSQRTGRFGHAALALSSATVVLGAVLSFTAPSASSTAPATLVTPPQATPGLSGLAGVSGLAGLTNADSPLSSLLGAPVNTPGSATSTTTGPGSDVQRDSALSGLPATVSTLPQPSDGQSDCGGVTELKSDGTPWACTFDDEFDGSTLNPSKWLVQQTANSGFHSGNECYVNSTKNVSVSDGVLDLTARQEAAPFTCSSPGLSYQTQYTAGMVSTDYRFDQTYGLYLVRAKLPASTIKGLQETLWLWPADASKYGTLPQSGGEIDFAEFYSEYPNLDIPVLHYRTVMKDPHATADCTITDPNAFHTYGLEWTDHSITTYLDGQVCMSDVWQPMAPETAPQPFNQPFFICLTQALGMETNNFVAGTTPLPATTQVDWVRAWS